MSVLIDTGVLFAFLNEDDSSHDGAKDLVERMARRELGAPFVCDLVVSELFTLIRVRTGSAKMEEAALRLLPLPTSQLAGLQIICMLHEDLLAGSKEFLRHRDQAISFADACQLFLMKERGLGTLATFDERLGRLAASCGRWAK
jgi:predicted nucleic acid-binding protein